MKLLTKVLKIVGIFVLLSILAIGAMYAAYLYEETQATKRISSSELQLQHVSLSTREYYKEYRVTGRIINRSSQYVLNEVQLKFTFLDCIDHSSPSTIFNLVPSEKYTPVKESRHNKNECIIIAEEKKSVYMDIPPGQARDFVKSGSLYNAMDIKEELEWDYSIEYTKAQ